MSINPVPASEHGNEPTISDPRPRSRPSPQPSETVRLAKSVPGTHPKREEDSPQGPNQSTEIPQDEVQVQRDGGTNGKIVIKYLDHSGNMILQIPSAQLLGLARAIEQALQDQANRRNDANDNAVGSEGGTSDGH